MDFYRRISAELPSWAFIYVSPFEGITPMPVILNQGKTHLFVTGQGRSDA
jgi:hypothetical protein